MVLMTMVAIAAALLVPSRGSAQSQTAPTNTGEPNIVGVAVEGKTLTASNGSWSGTTPLTFSYSWRRCDASGGAPNASNCGVISGQKQSSYKLRAADVTYRIRVRVTAKNADGSATATSNPTVVVNAAAATAKPVNTTLPTISGTPAVNGILTANPGAWTGTQPITLAFQWQRCDEKGKSCAGIIGATAKTYTLKSVDLGNTLRIRVTATNNDGSAGSTSAQTAVIRTSAPQGGCANGSPVNIADLSSSDRLLVYRVRVSPSVIHRSTNSISVSVCITSNGRPVQGALVYVTAVPFNQFSIPAEQPTDQNGSVGLSMNRLVGFPVSNVQQLLVLFVRTRQPGGSLLGASSRLVSAPVNQ
jgi:hypothetical protein